MIVKSSSQWAGHVARMGEKSIQNCGGKMSLKMSNWKIVKDTV
jgi:hypothetical protein